MMLVLLVVSFVIVFALSGAAMVHKWLLMLADYRARKEGL